ncbi:tRNA-U16,U17-dihydrouridine synthase [Tranquillimonas rosea]|uniref:tRNA-dihydrouridine(20/20a) synthase n=1 Tax=Tranquillimonas rosea TaxID=641238 RepID=A0A1H9PYY0_9RHOB|nr:tRNA dihydrouridine(20/20a) synthase DusA [Tranquillimonas rosea]SER53394.1 tRNA-U16,U17-dihydrouridine synthase [Tranquillimonas rosea]
MTMTTQEAARLSIAPMMDWTDRHCRMFHRQMSRHALLYTEMVTSAALVRGGARQLLRFDPAEHPVALQLGGSEPAELAQAARMGEAEGYDEINLNVGCPSDRVQAGTFGAVLMTQPALVAECVAAMQAAVRVPVTVKCRIGVDEQDPEETLPDFLDKVRAAGTRRVIIHARKAWLQGLSPKENRDIPPLDHDLVRRMKARYPDLHVSLNGGIAGLDAVEAKLHHGFDGVMVGRAAYHDPAAVLLGADARLWGAAQSVRDRAEIVEAMRPHIAHHLESGGKLAQVTRHMLGLFAGQPGARAWRRILSERGQGSAAGLDVLDEALAAVPRPALEAV